MIDILVVDTSAEQRARLCDRILALQSEVTRLTHAAPQVSLRPAAPQELAYLKQPDFVILGKGFLTEDLVQIASVKKSFPESHIIAEVSKDLASFAVAEQMVRLGVDDMLSDEISAPDFFRKMILLGKKERTESSGKLIVVDSGKGGTGVTTMVAALGEVLRSHGKRVCLIDLDTETQDLTRFLQVRPTVNENLSAVLEQGKAIVKECVDQMLVSIDGDSDLNIVTPPVFDLMTHDPRSQMIRTFLAVLEQLDTSFDVVIIDVAGLRGALQLALQRIADCYLYVANPELASIFATIHAIQRAAETQIKQDIRIMLNTRTMQGLPRSLVSAELVKATGLDASQILAGSVPWSQALLSWPGSAGSLFTGSAKKIEHHLSQMLAELSYIDLQLTTTLKPPVIHRIIERTVSGFAKMSARRGHTPVKKISIQASGVQQPTVAAMPAIEPPRIALPMIE